jgi:hypothetical protein
VTGSGKFVVVGGPLLGRKIKFKPVPAKFPVKFESTPSGGGGAGGAGTGLISSIWKPGAREIAASVLISCAVAGTDNKPTDTKAIIAVDFMTMLLVNLPEIIATSS